MAPGLCPGRFGTHLPIELLKIFSTGKQDGQAKGRLIFCRKLIDVTTASFFDEVSNRLLDGETVELAMKPGRSSRQWPRVDEDSPPKKAP